MSMWDVSDMRDDVYEHMRVVRGRLMQAGIPDARAPRYGWKDAKAGEVWLLWLGTDWIKIVTIFAYFYEYIPITGESSRLLSQTSLSNTSLNNGYISDNGPLNTNNNNSNDNFNNGVDGSSGYTSVNLAGYISSDGEGYAGRFRRNNAGGSADDRSSGPPRLPAGVSMELATLGSNSRESGFHNPLEGTMCVDELGLWIVLQYILHSTHIIIQLKTRLSLPFAF